MSTRLALMLRYSAIRVRFRTSNYPSISRPPLLALCYLLKDDARVDDTIIGLHTLIFSQ